MALKIKHISRFRATTAAQLDEYNFNMRWRHQRIGQQLAAVRKEMREAGLPWGLVR